MPPSTTGKLYKRQASELRLGHLQVRACKPASRHEDTASYLAHKNQRTVRHPELLPEITIFLAQPRAADAWNKWRPTDVSRARSFITKKDVCDVGLVKVQPVDLGPNR